MNSHIHLPVLHHPFSTLQKIVLTLLAGTAYLAGFYLVYPFAGLVAGGLALLPVITAGFLCGKRGAYISVICVIFAGMLILHFQGYDFSQPEALVVIILGDLFILISAMVIGWTNSLLHHIGLQNQSLDKERSRMAAEIEMRKKIEINLRKQSEFNEQLQQGLTLLSAEMDHSTIFDRILEQLKKVIVCDSISILLFEEEKLVVKANIGHPNANQLIGKSILIQEHPHTPSVRIFKNNEAILIDDLDHEPGWVSFTKDIHIRSWVGVPLSTNSGPIGVLSIDSFMPNTFQQSEVQLMQALARPVGLMVENIRLYHQAQMEIKEREKTAQRLQQRLDAEKLVAKITTRLINTDLSQIEPHLKEILADLGQFAGAERCFLTMTRSNHFSLENDFVWLDKKVDSRPTDRILTDLRQLEGLYQKLTHFETIYIPQVADMGEDAAPMRERWLEYGIQSCLLIPLKQQDRLLGVLGFQTETKKAEWSQGDILSFQLMANIFSSFWARRSAERNQQEKLLFVQHILDSIPTPVFYINTDGTYLGCNRVFSQSYGIEKEEMIGKSAYDFNPRLRADYLMEMDKEVMESGQSRTIEETDMFADGSLHTLMAYKAPFFDLEGKVSGLIGVMVDITAQKNLEIELQGERSSLADRVKQQTAELRIANQELERAAKAKDEFLAAMSHELRTPLNAILGLNEALQEKIYGPLTPKQETTLERIHESGLHLLSLISDILDLAKIGADRLELDWGPVDAAYICQTSIDMLRDSAEKKRLSLHLQMDPQVQIIQADGRRLKQILLNLLSNAVKFTPAGGRVGLEMEGDPQTEVVRFHIWDSGIGISEKDLKYIFKPFQQVDSSLSRPYEGAGLGLALAAEMVEMHHGTISVTSTPHQGSHFCVSLPWKQLQSSIGEQASLLENASVPQPPIIAPNHRACILIAEDNPSNLETMADYLQANDFRVTYARDGKEAVRKAKEIQPDLILMDIQMPEMNGLEAMRLIRQEKDLMTTPIIAITALAMPGDLERCLAAGANDYLTKPIQLKELYQRIHFLLHPESEAIID